MNRKLVQFLLAGLLMTQVVGGQTRPTADSPQDSPRRAGASAEGQQQTTNTTIERLLRERRSEEEIVRRIQDAMQSGTAQFDISPTALLDLHKKGASDRVLNAMMADGSVRYGRPGALAAGPSSSTPFVGADALNPQPFPPKSRVPAILARMQLSKGPAIRISGLQPAVPMSVTQVIHEQSMQTLAERRAPAPSQPRPQSNTTPAVALRSAPPTMMMARTNSVGTIGPTRTMGATTDPATGGTDPTGGTTPPAGTPGTTSGSTPGTTVAGQPSAGATPTGTTPTGTQTSGTSISKDAMLHAPKPIDPCILISNKPVVKTVSGRAHDIYFTPDPGNGNTPNNQYTLVGCNFGAAQGQGDVHLVANFHNNPSPVKLGIDSWSDTLIVVTFNPNFQNEYDMDNVTLVVTSGTGASTQITGNHFVATRRSRSLEHVPNSLVKLPSITLTTDQFVSPVTSQTLQLANMPPTTLRGTIFFYVDTQIWSSNVGDGYPQQRISFSDWIDFSKLHPGYQLDDTAQTFVVSGPTLSSGFNIDVNAEASCKYSDTVLGASMQGSSLGIGVQPAECNDGGKFIFAYYGLGLSVTGPAGDKLDVWQSGLN